jgi:hypothetical protein
MYISFFGLNFMTFFRKMFVGFLGLHYGLPHGAIYGLLGLNCMAFLRKMSAFWALAVCYSSGRHL